MLSTITCHILLSLLLFYLFPFKKSIHLVKGQGSAGYDALLHLRKIFFIQNAAITSLLGHEHIELGSDGLRTVGVGVVAQEVVVGCFERHLAGKQPRTALNIGVDL